MALLAEGAHDRHEGVEDDHRFFLGTFGTFGDVMSIFGRRRQWIS